jgi:riboflavin synthase
VDGVGEVVALIEEGEARRIRVAVSDELARYLVEKGSIAVDGVSLTVTRVNPHGESGWFEVVLIPHTLENSGLGGITLGTKVNLEVDILAKYVARMLEMTK